MTTTARMTREAVTADSEDLLPQELSSYSPMRNAAPSLHSTEKPRHRETELLFKDTQPSGRIETNPGVGSYPQTTFPLSAHWRLWKHQGRSGWPVALLTNGSLRLRTRASTALMEPRPCRTPPAQGFNDFPSPGSVLTVAGSSRPSTGPKPSPALHLPSSTAHLLGPPQLLLPPQPPAQLSPTLSLLFFMLVILPNPTGAPASYDTCAKHRPHGDRFFLENSIALRVFRPNLAHAFAKLVFKNTYTCIYINA